MKTLESKIRNNEFVFYIRTWDGIDKPEYDHVTSLNVKGAMNMIKELQDYVEVAKKNSTININGQVVSIEKAIEIRNELNDKLKEYGE